MPKRAARPAATSADTTPAPNSTPSASRADGSKASTSGCDSPPASAASSATSTRCAPWPPSLAAQPSSIPTRDERRDLGPQRGAPWPARRGSGRRTRRRHDARDTSSLTAAPSRPGWRPPFGRVATGSSILTPSALGPAERPSAPRCEIAVRRPRAPRRGRRRPGRACPSGFFLAPMIALIEGSRGVLMASDTDTTAGSGASARSYPCSVWRLALMPASLTSRCATWVTSGRADGRRRPPPSRSSRRRPPAGPAAPGRRPGPRSRSPGAYAVPEMSEPASPGSDSSTARSAPSANAFESAREALSGPMQTATISATSTPDSRIRTASSSACTSNGFNSESPDRSSRLVAGSSRREDVALGTSLTQTAIFTGGSFPSIFR